jgi:hypothetical protein
MALRDDETTFAPQFRCRRSHGDAIRHSTSTGQVDRVTFDQRHAVRVVPFQAHKCLIMRTHPGGTAGVDRVAGTPLRRNTARACDAGGHEERRRQPVTFPRTVPLVPA